MSKPEQPRDPLSIACELVGRYQYHFSRIDDALNEGIAKVFGLNEGASSVLLANMDFVKKVNIIRVMSSLQFTDDGSLGKLLDDIAGINTPDRQTVIHSTFKPHGGDSVKFKRTTTTREKLRVNESIWTSGDFVKRFATMEIRRAPEPQKAGTHPNVDFTTELGLGHMACHR